MERKDWERWGCDDHGPGSGILTPPEHSITRISLVAVTGTLTIPELTGIIRKAERAAQGEDNEP
jgi:hypothetical protein